MEKNEFGIWFPGIDSFCGEDVGGHGGTIIAKTLPDETLQHGFAIGSN